MSTNPELEHEQAYIDHAYQRVDELKEAARAAMNDVIGLPKGGTFQARTERDMVVRASLARLEQLDIGNQPLCFGRIDEVEGDRYYIGRLGVSGSDQEPLVVDWRAPIAEPFYRATGRVPMGLARRRHFSIQGRTVVGLEDEAFVMSGNEEKLPVAGQGALLAALERSRSGRMQDIVATIQGEQDEVIRSPLPGVLVVQGGPGTGKTAVALHRAAYLLYTYRFPLERQGVLVVGPNPVFLRYIGHVLPSLGETGVTLSTISGLVPDASIKGTDSAEAAAIKGDKRMAKVIARAVRNRQRQLKKDIEIPFGSYFLRFTTQDSASVISSVKRGGGTHNSRRRRVERLIAENLHNKYLSAVERSRKIDSTVRDAQLQDFLRSLREIDLFNEMLERMWPRLHSVELLHDLYGAKPLISLATKDILSAADAEHLFRPRSDSLDAIPWTEADIALLDEARVLLGPVRPLPEDEVFTPTYGHVVVDEAQDLSPMQLRVLGRRSLGGSMTIVGDIAQATGSWAPNSWDDVLKNLPTHWHARDVELTIGYRTPAEAMILAAKVLEQTNLGLIPPRPVRESGIEPFVLSVNRDSFVKEIASVVSDQSNDQGTIAVISPKGLIDELAKEFTDEAIDFVIAGSSAAEARVTLLNAKLAKGLEFDNVIVVEPAELLSESKHGLRSLYVALTRTTKQLSIVHAEPLPEFLTNN